MVFGKKCKMCGKDANIHHHQDNEFHREIENYWLCTKCNTAIEDFKYIIRCVETDTPADGMVS